MSEKLSDKRYIALLETVAEGAREMVGAATDRLLGRPEGTLRTMDALAALDAPDPAMLTKYLALERAMFVAEDLSKDALVDALRDAMDPLWHLLTIPERQWLNERNDPSLSAETTAIPQDEDHHE
jgi:hypothetical protein